MTETITAREANQHFSRLLREVAAGKEYVITRSGTPVAKLAPVTAEPGRRVLTGEQEQALADFRSAALANQVAADAEPAKFSRDELYDDRMQLSLRN